MRNFISGEEVSAALDDPSPPAAYQQLDTRLIPRCTTDARNQSNYVLLTVERISMEFVVVNENPRFLSEGRGARSN